jgi:hypothetical protein
VRRIATESMMPVVIKAGLDVARLVRPSAPRP